ncbi:ComF family protein [Stappia sp. P2PMeth1]|uniref:ComF family protein n=1 Tax=Stappia sp. P2PMeth1 TaxID=2003586 RepID=UPI001FCA720A|nr:ComF family protein [Stappia sp. P2PMeth1]
MADTIADTVADTLANTLAGGDAAARRGGIGAAMPVLAAAGRRLLDLLLPPTCLACDAIVGVEQTLCPSCWSRMPFLAPPWCERLGLPFAYDLGPGALSPQAIARPPAFERLRAVAAYGGPARVLVARLKYHDRPSSAGAMGRWMARTGSELLAPRAGEAGPPLLVPVPLHRLRMWSRRYNQAGLLAREIGRAGGVEVLPQALVRRKRTRQQVGLDAAARARNVSGAFAVTPQGLMAISGRRVVLVDDVYTTGATVGAATRTLLREGATAVDVLVFAHAGADAPLG